MLFILIFTQESRAQWRHTNAYASTFTDIQFTDYKNGFAVGRDTGIGSCSPSQSALFRTMDGGKTWVRNALAESNEMTSIFFLTESLGWATGYYGETYKTTDCGATWTMYPSGIPQKVHDVHFINSNTGFCVAEDGHIRKSSNGGASWSFNFDAGNQFLYDVHFLNDNLGFVVGSSGALLRTTNGGANWTSYNLGSSSAQFCIAFLNAEHGFVSSYNKIYETQNAGDSWTEIPIEIEAIRGLDFPSSTVGYLGGYRGDMMKTTDGGTTWIPLETPFRESIFKIDFLDEYVGYVCGEYGSIFHTTDGGITWKNQYTGLYFAGEDGVSNEILGMSFLNGDTGMYVGLLGAMYVTRNAGLTWILQEPLTLNSLNNVQWIDENQIITVGNGGTVMKSNDAAETWEFLDTGYDLDYTKVWFNSDAQVGYAMNYNDSLVKTTDGGLTWELQIIPSGSYLRDMDFLNENYGLVVATDAVFRTLDGGANWEEQTYIEAIGGPRSVKIVNDTLSFIGAVNILRSIDGGAFFDSISVSTSLWADDIDFINDTLGYLISGSDVRQTIDGGIHWQSPAIPCWNNSFSLNAIDYVDENHAYAAGKTPTSRLWKGEPAISTYVVDDAFCAGSKLNVGYFYEGAINSGNTYVAQLSDTSGDFNAPINIGTYTSPFISLHPSCLISCIIPSNTPAGTGYRIRVLSTDPELIGADNLFDITITNSLMPSASLSQVTGQCADEQILFEVEYDQAGNLPTFDWLLNGILINHSAPSWMVDTLQSGDQVQVELTSSATCASPSTVMTALIDVIHEALPEVNSSGDVEITTGESVQLSAAGALTYTWSPALGLDDPNSDTPICSAVETTTYIITGTDGNGCSDSDTLTVTVLPFVAMPMVDFMASDTVIITGTSISFENLSIGEVDEWFWTFEGGTPASSDLADPGLIQYPEEGCFEVTLTASNAGGSDALTKLCYIVVDDLCIPEIQNGATEAHHINGVYFGGAENLNNGFNAAGYQDFGDEFVNDFYLCPGWGNKVIVYCGAAINDHYAVWVDWNADEIFAEDELMAEGFNTEPYELLILQYDLFDSYYVEFIDSVRVMRIRNMGPTLVADPCITVENGETEDYQALVTICEGISELEKSFRLSPNPAHEYLEIRMTSAAGVSFIFLDALGRVLDSGPIKEGRDRLDVSSYATGNYVLKVEKGQESFSRKVVVDHK